MDLTQPIREAVSHDHGDHKQQSDAPPQSRRPSQTMHLSEDKDTAKAKAKHGPQALALGDGDQDGRGYYQDLEQQCPAPIQVGSVEE